MVTRSCAFLSEISKPSSIPGLANPPVWWEGLFRTRRKPDFVINRITAPPQPPTVPEEITQQRCLVISPKLTVHPHQFNEISYFWKNYCPSWGSSLRARSAKPSAH